VTALVSQCPTPFERRYHVESVVEAGLDDRYARYLRTLKIVDDAGLDISITSDPEVIIALLRKHKMFDPARELANEQGLSVHPITLHEVESHVSEFQESYLWDLEFTRMALRQQFHLIFLTHRYEPLMAGDFFFTTVESMDYGSDEGYSERAMLLTFALNWYSGRSDKTTVSPLKQRSESESSGPLVTAGSSTSLASLNASSASVVRTDSAPLTPAKPLKSPEFIAQLENRIWLANISAELGLASSKTRIGDSLDFLGAPVKAAIEGAKEARTLVQAETQLAAAATAGDRGISGLAANLVSSSFAEGAAFVVDQDLAIKNERELNTLNTAIGRLLNAGMVQQALSLCAQFKHKSKDLQLVRTSVMLVEDLLKPHEVPQDLAPALKTQDVEGVVTELRDLAQGVKECIDRILRCSLAGVALNFTYVVVVLKDPAEVFQTLLMCGPAVYKVAKGYVTSNRLAPEKVAEHMADAFCKALLEKR